MAQQLGNIQAGQTLHCYFESYDIFGCSARPMDDNPGIVRVYKDGGSTYTADGLTYDTDCFLQAGINRVSIDTSGGFYELGHDYVLVLIGAFFFTHPSLGSPQIQKNLVLAEFSIGNRQPDAESVADAVMNHTGEDATGLIPTNLDAKVSTIGDGLTDASDFTGVFSASVLANAPRTGMVLSASSLARGPEASLTDEDIVATVFKGGSPRLCALVYLNGSPITQADVSTITYTVYELGSRPDDRTAITGHTDVSLSAANVIYDSLQTDAQASKFNFAHQVPVSVHSAFTTAGRSYQVEYLITPTVGEVVIARFSISCI